MPVLSIGECIKFGWAIKRQSARSPEPAGKDVVFAFDDAEELGPIMLSKIAKRTGLRPEDL